MKLNIPRIFEKSKLLTTEVGQQISEFLDFMTDFSEQVTRALRNQITIADNMDAIVSEVSVPHETESIVYTGGKTPMGITILKVANKDLSVDSFRWYVDESNQTRVWVSYGGVSKVTINSVSSLPVTINVDKEVAVLSSNIKFAIYFN